MMDGMKDSNPKDLIGCKKPSMAGVPLAPLFMLGAAMVEGTKYGRHNYRVIGVKASVYYNALWRHIADWWEGQNIDPKSGLPHLAKAMACMTIILDAEQHGMLNDDRPPRTDPRWMEQAQADMDKVLDNLVGVEIKAPYTQVRADREAKEAGDPVTNLEEALRAVTKEGNV